MCPRRKPAWLEDDIAERVAIGTIKKSRLVGPRFAADVGMGRNRIWRGFRIQNNLRLLFSSVDSGQGEKNQSRRRSEMTLGSFGVVERAG
jgi:hypothetical protein